MNKQETQKQYDEVQAELVVMNNLEWIICEGVRKAQDGSSTYRVYPSRHSYVLEVWKGQSLRELNRFDTEGTAMEYAETHANRQHNDRVNMIEAVVALFIFTIFTVILYSCS
jgi:hypothetical protein